MRFKNLKFYSLNQKFSLDLSQLGTQLQELRFKPCQSQELESCGWTKPVEQTDELVQHQDGVIWLCLKREQKLLPASVINDELNIKLAHIEKSSGSKPSKKEQKELKEDIINILLPKAFSKFSTLNAYVDTKHNFVAVNTSTDASAELFLAFLRKTLGSLPVTPLSKHSQNQLLTQWVTDSSPEKVELLDELELRSSADDGGIIKCKNFALDNEDILNHIQSGMLVTYLSICFDEHVNFIINEDLTLKRIKYSDIVFTDSDEISNEDPAAKASAEFAINSDQLRKLMRYMQEWFSIEL